MMSRAYPLLEYMSSPYSVVIREPYFQDLKDPPTGKGVEAGSVTAATWKWYTEMDAALGGQDSVNAPLVVASNLTATSGGVVVRKDPASTPSTSQAEEEEAIRPKRRRESREDVLDFLREQAERDEERNKEEVKREEEREKREEERERAASHRAERYLSLFEKLVDKM